MNHSPRLSIIIPCYNMGEFIRETLDSVTSYPNKEEIEIIVVNDGSNDADTISCLKALENEGIFVHHQVNMGLAAARNNGVKLAKGDYILPLDADNKIRHRYISESIQLFDSNKDIDIIYGYKQHFDEDNKLIEVPEFDFPLMCEKNYIDACACFRKSLWEELGGYDENMPVMGYEDWDFWLRSALRGAKFHRLNEVVFDYRVRNDSMISDTNDKYYQIKKYIFGKKELAVVNAIGEANKKANEHKHLKNSAEYKLGKILLSPFRLFR